MISLITFEPGTWNLEPTPLPLGGAGGGPELGTLNWRQPCSPPRGVGGGAFNALKRMEGGNENENDTLLYIIYV